MALNELCTNTTKFGALSVPEGHVSIGWTVDAAASLLHFTWKEQNGPVVVAPTRQSFGTRLIETLGRQLKGDVRLTYEPTGFAYALNVPLVSLDS
jgi:two-component sensor histidine kinase